MQVACDGGNSVRDRSKYGRACLGFRRRGLFFPSEVESGLAKIYSIKDSVLECGGFWTFVYDTAPRKELKARKHGASDC